MDRRDLLIAGALGATLGAAHAAEGARQPSTKKVLRYAFPVAESGLDPAKISDMYSRTLTPHIFEGLYTYDYLARPIKFKPLTAAAMPEVSPDYRVWTCKVRPGIYFPDDPAFKGQRRELVAQDYVYSFKRFADPANISPIWTNMESEGYVGLPELRKAALDGKKPFDYDSEVAGVRALDRYTVQFVLAKPRPHFIENLAGGDLYGAVAREVVEFYGDALDAHPVGTGPFRLVEWRRSSFIALERNPFFREMLYDGAPAADDAQGLALLAKFKGRRLPMVDRVEVSIVEESQPRWLSFVIGDADIAYSVSPEFAEQAMPHGKVAPNLAKKGIQGHPVVVAAGSFIYFNMEDPTIGGYTPDKVALRRAIGLGMDVKGLIEYAFSGLAIQSQGPTYPNTVAYDPAYKSEFSDYDPARAQALLDVYGYRHGHEGWRTLPDGSPLALTMTRTSEQIDRRIVELLTRNMTALGIRLDSQVGQWPENYKASRAGKLQMWMLGGQLAGPDAGECYSLFDSTQIGSGDYARFKLPAMDELYQQIQALPDGPERLEKFREASRIALAYMPYKFTFSRVQVDMTQPQLVGYRRPIFWQDWWQYVDIDMSLVPKG